LDPFTHAVLGAACAIPGARPAQRITASAAGALAAMAPDADIFIRSAQDPLAAVEYHRHFTHSLAFIPFGALICAVAFVPLMRRRMSLTTCYLACLAGYASHGILDACTSYGTQLFWPFARTRVAFDWVSVVDPLFTVPLLVLVVLGIRRHRAGLVAAGLAWCVAYLGLGAFQNHRATLAAAEVAMIRGHDPASVDVKPSFGNLLLWKSIYEHEGRFYIDAIRTGLSTRAFEGASMARVELARDFPWLTPEWQQWHDVERFAWFADAYLGHDDLDSNTIADLRYSLVPNRLDPLWGLRLDRDAGPSAHAAYVTMRLRSLSEGKALLRMVFPGDSEE